MKRTIGGTIERVPVPRSIPDEQALEDVLVEILDSHGISWQRQVQTKAGRADVVTDTTVYEVKLVLNRPALYHAFGQVTLFAAALGKPRRVIVGYPHRRFQGLIDAIREQGVEINVVP